ncbi:hypothetical protein [uncultured Gammaproteobacteria bacterium]|nr:hypothetical protein [uncultured Gammaproteobacteria bacterium]CAC9471384.1 hypothetical protein [uncultured Gammaproteobacteria bacterium]
MHRKPAPHMVKHPEASLYLTLSTQIITVMVSVCFSCWLFRL